MPDMRSDEALRSAVLDELPWDSLIDESQGRCCVDGSGGLQRACSSRASCSGLGGVMSGGGTFGGDADAAGFTPIHPHFTPWANVRRRMPCIRRIVDGATGRPLTPPAVRRC